MCRASWVWVKGIHIHFDGDYINIETQQDDTSTITLTWPLGEFTEIQMSDPAALSGLSAIPGLNPASVSTWSEMTSVLGDGRYFRGVYTP